MRIGTLATASLLVLCTTARAEPRARPHDHYPAIVIGSGYGGSVAAFHLAQQRVKTLVLERGRRWTVDDPTTQSTFATLDSVTAPGGDARSSWLEETCRGNLYLTLVPPTPCPVSTGVLETLDATANQRDLSPPIEVNGVSVVVGAGVGGGSLVNNGVTYKPTKAGFDAAFPPSELPHMQRAWYELDRRYFELALARLRPEPTPADVLSTPYYAGTNALYAIAAALGYPPEDPALPSTLIFGRTIAPQTVDWGKVREEIAGTRAPSVIRGDVWWGVNSGAKESLELPRGYLGKAVASGYVDVRPLHTVTDVSYNARSKLYSVQVVQTDEAYTTLATMTFTTRQLFLAAGSIGTTKLLVRARDTGALPALNDHVGTLWSTNGNTVLPRILSSEPMPQGGLAGVKITDFSVPDNPVVVENLPQRVPAYFAQIPELAPVFGALMLVALGVPAQYGSFRFDAARDVVVLDWPPDGAANVFERFSQITANMPGVALPLSLAQAQRATLHPLGGVPYGLATEENCELKGYNGLYVVDGSLVPGPGAVTNPSLLITAMAERCMSKIAGCFGGGWRD
jgi:cholesterol oxidase